MARSESPPVGMVGPDRVLHVPGDQHGVTRCGVEMEGEWTCGPIHRIVGEQVIFPLTKYFDTSCEECFGL
jgi:hypothetical protein